MPWAGLTITKGRTLSMTGIDDGNYRNDNINKDLRQYLSDLTRNEAVETIRVPVIMKMVISLQQLLIFLRQSLSMSS